MSGAEIRAHAAKFRAAGVKVTPLVVAATTKATLDTAAQARELTPVDTGYLRASIATTTGTDGTSVFGEVTAGANYAAYVEHGTSRMAPQPFMSPAHEANAAKWLAALAQIGGQAL
jgi:HK97 gp10 family phage protein